MFLQELPARLAQVRAAVEQNDPNALNRAAHSLKGAAGCLSLTSVASLAAHLEEQGHNGKIDSASGVLSDLEQKAQAVVIALAAELPEVRAASDAQITEPSGANQTGMSVAAGQGKA